MSNSRKEITMGSVRGFTIKDNPQARATLAKALEYDEKSKQESYQRAKAYLEERDETPAWMWNVLWFVLGFLMAISLDVTILKTPLF